MSRNNLLTFRFLLLLLLVKIPAATFAAPNCGSMDLPVARMMEPPEAYRAFCSQYAPACDLEGSHLVEWSKDNRALIEFINSQVNEEITLVSDWEFNGLDDVWDYPTQCAGDCEDFALEKRRRLVEQGLPGASLTMAIAFDEQSFLQHAVLLVETSMGTWVLDNNFDKALCWDIVPYTFTHREQPNGQWARFMKP